MTSNCKQVLFEMYDNLWFQNGEVKDKAKHLKVENGLMLVLFMIKLMGPRKELAENLPLSSLNVNHSLFVAQMIHFRYIFAHFCIF